MSHITALMKSTLPYTKKSIPFVLQVQYAYQWLISGHSVAFLCPLTTHALHLDRMKVHKTGNLERL